ncbi:MAG: pectate lyase [Verrucomicrobiales bacterium]|nr:pectate lyase [Verrucomicrobiales bacterium]
MHPSRLPAILPGLLAAVALPLLAQEPAAPPPKPRISVDLSADFLALHVKIQAPEGTTKVQYRFGAETAVPTDSQWTDAPPLTAEDRRVSLDLPLPRSRWTEFQARALKDTEVLATSTKRHTPRALTLVTPERLAALPESDRPAWTAYVEKSARLADAEFDHLAAECRAAAMPRSRPAPSGGEFEIDDDTPDSWYRSDTAARLAAAVISFQTPSGGWSKSLSFEEGSRQPGTHWTSHPDDPWHYSGTLDNRATTEQIRYLAIFHSITGDSDARAAALRGLEWLLSAQYPNGGWPQNYPLESGYHEAITLNDNAMLHAMQLALDASRGEAPFTFVDAPLRQRLAGAFDRALDCLSAAQVSFGGKPSIWCAQHDPLTLQPAAARLKEPPSLSGGESAEMLKFLMREGPLTDRIVALVEPAVAWLDAHRVTGLKKTKNEAGKTDYIADPASDEVYWARFYDPVTARPLFAGSQDGIVYATFTEMAAKNKVSYDYFVTRPGEVIGKEMDRWRKRMDKEGFTPAQPSPGTDQPSR